MRHLPLLIVLSLAACGPVASSTDDTDAGPADAPTAAADVPTAGEADASGAWRGGLCLAVSGDPDPWCIAAQSRDAGPDGAWCHLRDLRDGDTGLTPWRECIAWAIRAQSSVLPRGVPAWVADCAPPPPCQGVTAHHCPGRAVHYGVEVQQWVYLAHASGRCWPAR